LPELAWHPRLWLAAAPLRARPPSHGRARRRAPHRPLAAGTPSRNATGRRHLADERERRMAERRPSWPPGP